MVLIWATNKQTCFAESAGLPNAAAENRYIRSMLCSPPARRKQTKEIRDRCDVSRSLVLNTAAREYCPWIPQQKLRVAPPIISIGTVVQAQSAGRHEAREGAWNKPLTLPPNQRTASCLTAAVAVAESKPTELEIMSALGFLLSPRTHLKPTPLLVALRERMPAKTRAQRPPTAWKPQQAGWVPESAPRMSQGVLHRAIHYGYASCNHE